MKKLWFPISLLALAALLAMCAPKNKKTDSDSTSVGGAELYPTPTSPSGDTLSAQVEKGDPAAPEDSTGVGEDVRQPAQPRPQPPRHGSPDQEEVDSIKEAKTKRKKLD